MKSQDRPKVIHSRTAFTQDEDYVDLPINNQSEQISQYQTNNTAKFDIYSFLFRSTVVLILLAFLFVVALYYKVINP